MDSINRLNISDPPALKQSDTPSIKQSDPPESLLSSFKIAALSVTNLFKGAASAQAEARTEGYTCAIDELLTFLDKENLGLSNSEGRRIRKWALERLDGRDSASHNNESDDEGDKTDRGSSPICPRPNYSTRLSPPTQTNKRTVSPTRKDPTPSAIVSTTNEEYVNTLTTPLTAFTFQATYPYPQDADIILAEQDTENSRTSNQDPSIIPHTTLHASSLTLPRLSRNRGNHSNRLGPKSNSSLGKGVGQKRKFNFNDSYSEFFDIGNFGYGRDNFGGGGKRGRYI